MAQQFAIYDRCPIIRSPRRRRTSVSTQGDHPQENFPGELPKYNYVSLACLQSLFVSFPPPLFVLCWLFGFSSCVSLPLASVLLCVPIVVLLCSACSLSTNPPGDYSSHHSRRARLLACIKSRSTFQEHHRQRSCVLILELSLHHCFQRSRIPIDTSGLWPLECPFHGKTGRCLRAPE